ncbi:MAG: hypothetical protein DCC49_00315 [Acidobacteria bacterium]|nr:MAG: hypothetical protein DCC49_00315 [Acidobacteriota bacterium]
MTIDEKAAQLTSVWLSFDPDSGDFAPNTMAGPFAQGTDPEAIMAHGIGQITRPLGSKPIDPAQGVEMINDLQRRLVEGTRLGIPAICHEECLSGLMAQGATSFPSPLNFASTWDPELVERASRAIGRQMRSVGVHQGLAPVADVARDPRWGRIEETLGEDPYLVGSMVTAYVRGLQGDSLESGVIATLKHFCGYSFSEGGRNFAPAHVGRRELADVFLLPFEMAVRDGGAYSVMNAYQEIDGEAPAASRWLLTEVLRDAWGFEGFVVADYGAVSFLHLMHRVARDGTEAAAMAIRAGLDLELPSPAEYPTGIPDALGRGLLSMDDVDRSVTRVLIAKLKLGLFENPYVDAERIDLDSATDQELASEIATKSVTLLTNDGLLPLDASGNSLGKIAVIGPNADDVMALFGNYSYENHVVSTHFPEAASEIDAPTVRNALATLAGEERIVYAKGCDVMGTDTSNIEEAVAAASDAEVAIVVVGDKAGHFKLGTVGEGTDRADIDLPGVQGELVRRVIETRTPTVVVLLNGRPFALGGIARDAAAIIEAWFPGQGGGLAIAEAIFGVASPAGRTPVTFAPKAGVEPMYYNHKYLAPGFPRQDDFRPVFPFGHGLSYTTFEYSNLTISSPEADAGETVGISCTVTNTGGRASDEVVQLYVKDEYASVTRPVIELKGFTRIHLAPGESAEVNFSLGPRQLRFTGIDGRRIVEPGDFKVMVGASSADIRLDGGFRLTGDVIEVP